ncbi:hypothetical protein DL767_001128 [Monosporascus sp. MG133]|nr:hypothetical protein DL767_001128 [Monosporascus sp. MG133]
MTLLYYQSKARKRSRTERGHTVDRRLTRSQRGAARRPALFEHWLAKHPVVPPRCFSNRTITPCLLLVSLDSVKFAATCTYTYAGTTAAKGLGPRGATFFTSVIGIAQCLAGAAAVTMRRYKWICVLGAAVRLVGYGAVLRLQGAENGIAEISPSSSCRASVRACWARRLLVPAQIAVARRETR